ncbi:MAG TPA: sulfatase, partial [Myxococcota bacterium]|nr:sulfatase [Myxococcota bacterium]
MRRVALIAVAAVAACTLAGAWWVATTPPVPRHVIILSMDTTRADVLGAYGNPRAHTPHLDALAAEAVLFEHHYSAAPTTLASHTALMTGDHPHTHGVPRNDYKVNERNVMLQEILHDHGFTTAAFLGAMPLASHSNFTQGFDHVDETFTLHRATDGTGQSERPGDEVAKAVLDWLDAHPPGPDDRYLLFVHMFDAHAPYRPDPEELALYHPDPAIEDAGSVDHIERVQRMFAKKDPRAAAHAETLKELYLAGVATLDKHVGQLLDGLASRGTLDDALLIVTADHGETWDTHRERFDHGETVYDETIHTPLLVRFPGAWDAGDRVDAAVSNTDVAPTILALLGFDAPPTDGVSFAGALRWPLWDRGLPVFAEGTKPHLGDQQGWQNDPMEKAIIDADEKLILLPRSDRTELYDLADDPEELHNLRKERGVAALAEQLDAWRRGAHPLPSPR